MAAAIGLALAFRLAGLDARPMHHDEANQAIRFGQLLETGGYRYDAGEHHGPTLYYLTLPAAWLRGQHTTSSLDEWTVRVVPAVFGLATVLLLLALVPGIGRTAVVVSAVLMAVAPPLTYYSRFYIQESLLLFFTLGFVIVAGRCAVSARSRDALWAGAFAGLAIATKETAVILLPAALLACLAARRWGRRAATPGAGGRTLPEAGSREPGAGIRELPGAHVWAGAAVALAVAALFYSSFFTNLPGLVEPFRAAGVYFGRGLTPEAHRQAWYYYLQLLHDYSSGGIRWGGAGLLLLVIPGAGIAFRGTAAGQLAFWARCLLVYALITTAVFSALPYKTPWNVLPFYGAWLVLAGIGAAEPLVRTSSATARTLIALGVMAVCATLGLQAWRANFRYPADPRNPYAYVHTSPDVLRMASRVAAVSALHADRDKMLVAVVAGPSEQWPLPWYLRRMSRVGYWTTAAGAAGALGQAPVVIASPDNVDGVQAVLGERYQSEFYGLRPGVLMTVFIERSLWDRFIASNK